jgi:BMFP domain-containing protein YqiC
MTAKTAKAGSWRKALPRRLAELRRTTERRVRKGLDETLDMLPPVPRKALKRLTANVDRARNDLEKTGNRLVADARKRAERFAEDMQKRVESSVGPLMNRLDVASRQDVDRLQRRLHELERKIHAHGHASPPA